MTPGDVAWLSHRASSGTVGSLVRFSPFQKYD